MGLKYPSCNIEVHIEILKALSKENFEQLSVEFQQM